ncbi:MAG: VWA domain-containing protein [Acidobacteria bacterium]|nr:VWA domain-containing protein [Acidobacteriota bacterium]
MRSHTVLRVGFFAATLLVVLPATGAAQSGTPVQFASSIEVMRFHVGVNNTSGQFVSGLGVDDFEVLIDGESRTLVDALEVSDATRVDESLLPADPSIVPPDQFMAAEVPSPRLPGAARRHFLLFFDLTVANMRSLRYTREAALEFVQNTVLPSDVLGLATYSPRQGLQVPVAFTTNPRRVEEVLDAFAPGRSIEGVDPGGSGLDSAARTAVASNSIRERFEPLNGMFNLAAMDAFAAAGGAERMVRNAEDMLRGLGLLFDAMAPEQGRKHLLFFSNGLPNEVFTQGRFRDEAGDMIHAAVGTDTVVHTFMPDSVTVTNFDDASSDVIGGADPRTWDPMTGLGSQFGERDVMRFLPDETGGTATFYRSDLGKGLTEVEASTRSFYVLAFRMREAERDRVDVDVRVRDGLEIAWAPEELEVMGSNSRRTPLQSRLELASALESAADRADIRMDVRALPVSVRNGYGRAALVLQIDTRELDALRALREDDKLEFEMIGQAIDSRGEVRDFFRTRADSNSAGSELPFRYYNMVVVPPGRYHIRVVVQEIGTGRIASRRLAFEVPEAPDVTLRMSGPVIVKAGDGIVNGVRFGEQPAHRADLPVSYPFQIMERDLTPDLTSILSAGQRVELFALVYDLTTPDPSEDPRAGLDVALRNSAGDFRFIERFGGVVWERSPEDGAMRLGVQMWLPEDLPSGTWDLVVQATDLATYQSTDSSVSVTVLSATR